MAPKNASGGTSDKMKRVFLSSTGRDLQEYRDAVSAALSTLDDWHCDRMENFTAKAGTTASEHCNAIVRNCDLFIGLIAHCYGSVPKGESKSYTELEYDAASDLPQLMFIADYDFRVAVGILFAESLSKRRRQIAFRKRITTSSNLPGHARCFETPDKLAGAVLAALRNWEQQLASTRVGIQIGVNALATPPKTVFKDVDAAWCPELVLLPPGKFLMGAPDHDTDAYPDERPQHEVSIPVAFALGKYPVTFDQFDLFCEDSNYPKPSDEGWARGRYPVINVSWNDANAYVRWLAKRTGLPYRLPTEAEWEYACRAGSQTKFCCGDHLTKKHANYSKDSGRTTEVGSYPANLWGLYDMHGNVWEHVEDTYHPTYDGAPNTSCAWIEGADVNSRVVRGGSFSYDEKDNRSTVRCFHKVAIVDKLHGFRVARSIF